MNQQDTQQFILQNRERDVRQVALEGARHAAVDLTFALEQIQGWQTARQKLPAWAAIDGIVFPPHLNMEQCSSETTATYKQHLVARWLGNRLAAATLIDLTGGFGVDFSLMSRGFLRAIYVEQNEALCRLASHNFDLLGMAHAEVVQGDGVEWLHQFQTTKAPDHPVVIYLDPARRDIHGQKVFGLQDCSPDVTLLADELLAKADVVMVKLSPMLDWHAAVEALTERGAGAEVHIVSVGNECKELLLVLSHRQDPLRVVCVNDDERFSYSPGAASVLAEHSQPSVATALSGVLLVPNASVMKAGCFTQLCERFPVQAVGDNSHLFISPSVVADFPGRQFRIVAVSSLNKKELRQHLAGITQANVAVRNFPLAVPELRKRLKLRDGGSHYIFATTWRGSHVLIVTTK